MPSFRYLPTSDDGPNTFAATSPHFSKLDEDISSPNVIDFITATSSGKVDRFGFGSAPSSLGQCQTVTVWIHHNMILGDALDGTMDFTVRIYVPGGTIEFPSQAIEIENDSGFKTDSYVFSNLSLSKTDIEGLQVEFDSTALDGWGIPGARWRIYTLNVDIQYTESEKIIGQNKIEIFPVSTDLSAAFTIYGDTTVHGATRQSRFFSPDVGNGTDTSYLELIGHGGFWEGSFDTVVGSTITDITFRITHRSIKATGPPPASPPFHFELYLDIPFGIGTFFITNSRVPGSIGSVTGETYLFESTISGLSVSVSEFNSAFKSWNRIEEFIGAESSNYTWSFSLELTVIGAPSEKTISSFAGTEKVIIPTTP